MYVSDLSCGTCRGPVDLDTAFSVRADDGIEEPRLSAWCSKTCATGAVPVVGEESNESSDQERAAETPSPDTASKLRLVGGVGAAVSLLVAVTASSLHARLALAGGLAILSIISWRACVRVSKQFRDNPTHAYPFGQQLLIVSEVIMAKSGVGSVAAVGSYVLYLWVVELAVRREQRLANAQGLLSIRDATQREETRRSLIDEPAPSSRSLVKALAFVSRWALPAMLVGGSIAAIAGVDWETGLRAAASLWLLAPPWLWLFLSQDPVRAAYRATRMAGGRFPSLAVFELAGRVETVGVGLHGTLTTGALEVVALHFVQPASLESDTARWVAILAGVESRARPHAMRTAVMAFAEASGVQPIAVRSVRDAAGLGLTATTEDGEQIAIGQRRFLLGQGISVANMDEVAATEEARGRTVVFLSVGARTQGLVVFGNELRETARRAMQTLLDANIQPMLVTGDHGGTALAVAKQLDVLKVKAEMSESETRQMLSLERNEAPVAGIGPIGDHVVLSSVDVPVLIDGDASGSGVAARDLFAGAVALHAARYARTQVFRGLFVVALSVSLSYALVVGGLIGGLVSAVVAGASAWYLMTIYSRAERHFDRLLARA